MDKRSELTYGSLFSGIGGIDLGMDIAGFDCAWQVEVDDYCRQVLETHWPGVPKYGDIYEVKGSELESVDIICGGFPCQPVSQAGKRVGVDDERWLWDEFYRLICEVRPRWVVAENVPGLLSANSGRAFAGVLRDLAEGGYDAVWDVYPAGGPGGVGALHRRERIFIIGKLAEPKSKRHRRRTGKKRRIKRRKFQQKEQGRSKVGSKVEGRSKPHGDNMADNDRKRLKEQLWPQSVEEEGIERSSWWRTEPNVGRVANGVPNRVDRLKALGNAVVPQVAYKVARMISEYTKKEK